MHDYALHGFIKELHQRDLVKKAETFCDSWDSGYVAQDSNGDVYIYNTDISVTINNWFFAGRNPGDRFHRLSHLDAATQWQDRCLPVRAILQPQPGLNAEQQTFLQALDQAGERLQIRRFLNAWQSNSWLALDPGGRLYIFNNQPERTAKEWINGAHDIINSWARLDSISGHHLDWTRCLVHLSMLRQPPVPPAPVEINSDSRMDCWI
jgi:hypothetical protein